MKVGRRVLLLVSCVGFSLSCFGQLDRASLRGTITDPSGAVVPGATVTILETSTQAKFSTVTNNSGVYIFIGLLPGNYMVTTEKAGFKQTVRAGALLTAGASARVDLALVVGTQAQKVEVSAAPPLLETRSGSLDYSLDTHLIDAIPLAVNGGKRNMSDLERVVPGVQNATGLNNVLGTVGLYSAVVVDGLGAEYNSLAQGIMYRPESVDTVGEFRVVEGVNAEYGPTGGAFMSFTTKSGTNALHGDAYEFLRNDAFDTRNFFASKVGEDRQNEFGVSAGGPVVIPKLYNGRDKTFFFADFAQYILHATTPSGFITVPTTAMRQGDFSALLGPQIGTDALGRPVYKGEIYDPSTTRTLANGTVVRDPFPGNIIPSSQFSQVSSVLNGDWPAPTLTNQLQANYFHLSELNVRKESNYFFRADQNLNKGRFFATYKLGIGTVQAPNAYGPIFGGTYIHDKAQSIRVGLTHAFGQRIISDTELGFDRGNPVAGTSPTASKGSGLIGLKGVTGPCTPNISIVGTASFGGGNCNGGQFNTNWKFNQTFALSRGSHQIKFGGSVYHWNANFRIISPGNVTFQSPQTALPASFLNQTGYGYASFLLGDVGSGTLQQEYSKPLRNLYTGMFIQDEYRVTKSLTLDYGLRYEIQPPFTSPFDDVSSFEPYIPNPKAGGLLGALEFLGHGRGRDGRDRFAHTDLKGGWGPRFGFAYQVAQKTVVRGSYGIFHNPVSQFSGEYPIRQGFHPSYTFSSSGVDPVFNWTNGYPFVNPNPNIDATVANGQGSEYLGPDSGNVGWVQIVNFGVQHQVGNTLLEMAYSGNFAHHVGNSNIISLNQLNYSEYGSLGPLLLSNVSSPAAVAAGVTSPYPGFQGTVAQALRPYPQYLGVMSMNAPVGNSTYNALIVTAQRRFSNGLSFLAGYVYSKTLDNMDQAAAGVYAAQDAYNTRVLKAVCDCDITHSVVASWSYELPFGPGKRFLNVNNFLTKHAIGGWTLSAVQTYRSGLPLSVSTEHTLPATQDTPWINTTLLPNRVPGVNPHGAGCSSAGFNQATHYFVTRAAFSDPAPFTFGNSSHLLSDVRTCGFADEDFSLMKSFPIAERVRIEFGADAFNLFNRVNFGGFVGDIDSSAFGRTGGASASRFIQLHLKLLW